MKHLVENQILIQLGLRWGWRVYISNVFPDYTDIANSKANLSLKGLELNHLRAKIALL